MTNVILCCDLQRTLHHDEWFSSSKKQEARSKKKKKKKQEKEKERPTKKVKKAEDFDMKSRVVSLRSTRVLSIPPSTFAKAINWTLPLVTTSCRVTLAFFCLRGRLCVTALAENLTADPTLGWQHCWLFWQDVRDTSEKRLCQVVVPMTSNYTIFFFLASRTIHLHADTLTCGRMLSNYKKKKLCTSSSSESLAKPVNIISRMITGAEAGTVLLHKITRPTAWTREEQFSQRIQARMEVTPGFRLTCQKKRGEKMCEVVRWKWSTLKWNASLDEVARNAKTVKGYEEKRKEWAKHTEVEELKDKPWRSEELRSLEEGLPRLKGEYLEKAATGVGCDGFHPTIPLELSTKQERKSWTFLNMWNSVWDAATHLHDEVLPDSQEFHEWAAHCPFAAHDSLVGRGCVRQRWRVGSKGIVCHGRAEWRSKVHCVGDFARGGEIWLTCGRKKAKERSRWWLVWLKISSRSVSQWCGLGRCISIFRGTFCVCHVWTLSIRGACILKGALRRRSRPSRPFSLGGSGAACTFALSPWRRSFGQTVCGGEDGKRATEGLEEADFRSAELETSVISQSCSRDTSFQSIIKNFTKISGQVADLQQSLRRSSLWTCIHPEDLWVSIQVQNWDPEKPFTHRARPKFLRTLRCVRRTQVDRLDWNCRSITCRGPSALADLAIAEVIKTILVSTTLTFPAWNESGSRREQKSGAHSTDTKDPVRSAALRRLFSWWNQPPTDPVQLCLKIWWRSPQNLSASQSRLRRWSS